MWSKRNSQGDRCFECKKSIKRGEEELVCWKKNENAPIGYKNYSLIYCLSCGEKLKSKETELELNKAKALIRQAFADIAQIRSKETEPSTFTKQDYQSIKNWQKQLKELAKKKLDDDFINHDIQDLQNSCQELVNLIPQRIKVANNLKNKKKNKIRKPKANCSHSGNIAYDEEINFPWWCEKCGDDNSLSFLIALQKDMASDIKEDWFDKYNLSRNDLSNKDCFDKLLNTNHSKPEEIKVAWQTLAKELQALSKGKTNIPNQPPPNPNHQKEQEKTKLQEAIKNLTNKPNRTPEEEQALQDKKRKLEELTNPKQNQGNKGENNWGTYAVIVLIIGVIVGLSYLLVKSKSKNKH